MYKGMENHDESASDEGETPMRTLMRMPTGVSSVGRFTC